MQSLRVLAVMHEDLVPPPRARAGGGGAPWRTERDVLAALRALGHEVRPVGVHDDLSVLRGAIEGFDPHVCFNVLEEFHGASAYGPAVIGYVELLRRPFTGCNPRGAMLARDKVLAKKLFAWHGIPTPRFALYPLKGSPRPVRRPPAGLAFPLLVKAACEDASLGLSLASVVHTETKLAERVRFVHERLGVDALAEEYVDGRELYVGLVGNGRPAALPVWELSFERWADGAPRIATERVKWSRSYQERHGIASGPARRLGAAQRREALRLAREAWRALDLSGCARIDLRLAPGGRLYVLEANPNPDLARDEDFALAARAAGISYERLIQRLLDLARAWRPAWREIELAAR